MELDNLNLDCMMPADLRAAAAGLATLARYAELKARAVDYRAAGDVRVAGLLDARCDKLYGRLPPGFKW